MRSNSSLLVITSMYGKDNEIGFVKTNIDEGNLIYADIKRSLEWERECKVQFLTQGLSQQGSNLNILTKDRLVNFISADSRNKEKQLYVEENQVYGFTFEGKIYLNPDIMNSNVAVHEYTHLWDEYTKRTNPELWNKGKDILKNTYLWNEIKNSPDYADIADNEDLLTSEVHSRICGKIAQSVLERILKENGEISKDIVIDWENEVETFIAKEFSTEEISEVKEFFAQPMKDLINRKNILMENTVEENKQMENNNTIHFYDIDVDENYFNEQVSNKLLPYFEEYNESCVDDSEKIKLTGVKFYGENEGQLKILVGYKGNLSEDSLFNILNEAKADGELSYNGFNFDMNPIKPEKSGTIEEYLESLKVRDFEEKHDIINKSESENIFESTKGSFTEEQEEVENKKTIMEIITDELKGNDRDVTSPKFISKLENDEATITEKERRRILQELNPLEMSEKLKMALITQYDFESSDEKPRTFILTPENRDEGDIDAKEFAKLLNKNNFPGQPEISEEQAECMIRYLRYNDIAVYVDQSDKFHIVDFSENFTGEPGEVRNTKDIVETVIDELDHGDGTEESYEHQKVLTPLVSQYSYEHSNLQQQDASVQEEPINEEQPTADVSSVENVSPNEDLSNNIATESSSEPYVENNFSPDDVISEDDLMDEPVENSADYMNSYEDVCSSYIDDAYWEYLQTPEGQQKLNEEAKESAEKDKVANPTNVKKIPQAILDKSQFHKFFVENAYVPGTPVPAFGYRNNHTGHVVVLEGWEFSGTENNGVLNTNTETYLNSIRNEFITDENGKKIPNPNYNPYKWKNTDQTVILSKLEGNERKYLKISAEQYNTQIENSCLFKDAEKITKEVRREYVMKAQLDENEQRPNNAENFQHNYVAFCRKGANNVQEAMDFAKSLITKMRPEEREKLKTQMLKWESLTGESYTKRLADSYDSNVSDKIITDKTPFASTVLDPIRYNTEVIDREGSLLDKSCNLKVGDTVKMSISVNDCLGRKKVKIPTQNLILVSHSPDLNSVVLMDEKQLSKYVIPRDEFVKNVQKMEKKRSRSNQKVMQEEVMSMSD